ncbi:hypothetical protein C5167_034564 [Papaver somniferum]|uniref:Anaphase-promoting complex subunit 4 WD40 domain-containing protein n=1 Tax=Papaver somniferum TaxID=3469 RepID=A0A4Y7KH52_PAPSO|nr:hypothetical protein C5167_034564 [Papaver somniferum]
MQAVSREDGNALALGGPRPMGWSTVPFNADHQSAVYTMKFNPSGSTSERCNSNSSRNEVTMTLQGHSVTITGHQHNFEKTLLKCSWSGDGSKVPAGSADRMVYIWDTTSVQSKNEQPFLNVRIYILGRALIVSLVVVGRTGAETAVCSLLADGGQGIFVGALTLKRKLSN